MNFGRLVVHALSRSTQIASGIFIPPTEREITRSEWLAGRADCAYQGEIVPRFCAARAALSDTSDRLSDPSAIELALAVSKISGARVLDFGGGAGVHYSALRRFGFDVSRYVIVETQQMIDAARSAGLSGVEFKEAIPDEPFDIVFSAGALQSTDDPMSYLAALVAIRAPTLLLTRNAFSDRPRYFMRENKLFDHGSGPIPDGFSQSTVTHYSQSLPFDEVKVIVGRHYEIVMQMQNTTGIPSQEGVFGVDLLCNAIKD